MLLPVVMPSMPTSCLRVAFAASEYRYGFRKPMCLPRTWSAPLPRLQIAAKLRSCRQSGNSPLRAGEAQVDTAPPSTAALSEMSGITRCTPATALTPSW